MRVDLYTKMVLTGILGCLLWLCIALTPIGTPAHAQLGPTQVVIAGYQAGGSTHGLDRGLPVVMVSGAAAAAPTAQPSTAGVAAPVAPARPAQAGGRCQATTQRGTQCSRSAKAGSRFCWQHGASE